MFVILEDYGFSLNYAFIAVQITPQFTSDAPKISGGGLDQVYHLVQYHFHWGQQDSEGL